jgi:hypothetical protein
MIDAHCRHSLRTPGVHTQPTTTTHSGAGVAAVRAPDQTVEVRPDTDVRTRRFEPLSHVSGPLGRRGLVRRLQRRSRSLQSIAAQASGEESVVSKLSGQEGVRMSRHSQQRS